MRYGNDGFARVIGGAVKTARPGAEVDTCEDFGYVTLENGQVFRFEVREVTAQLERSAAARQDGNPR